jgi:N utilization substance protein B
LTYHPEVPGKVVINEAIELGKKYSTKESASFLNGILDSIYKIELKRND